MSYKFFTNSEQTWEAMYRAIEEAKVSVFLEMYIFNNDTKIDFLKLLKTKSENGVKVKLVLDSFGSVELGRQAVSELENGGVEVLFLSHFIHRLHRKILIIDEGTAFLGGVNIHNDASNWRDLAVKVKGKLAAYATHLFLKDYRYAGGRDVDILNKIKSDSKKWEIKKWLIEHSPMRNKFTLNKIYKENFDRAQKDIVLVTPYFAPKKFLIGLLHQTVLRGVKVKILVPESTEMYLLNKANYFYMTKCAKLGIEFYLMPKMNHAKAMIIDGKEAMVGSQNLDFLSFSLNAEVGVWFKDEASVSKVKNIVDEWGRESKVFNPVHYELNFFEKILARILNYFVMFL